MYHLSFNVTNFSHFNDIKTDAFTYSNTRPIITNMMSPLISIQEKEKLRTNGDDNVFNYIPAWIMAQRQGILPNAC